MIRLAPALRLQFVAWPAALTWPWLVLAAAFVINVGIFAVIGDLPGVEAETGGLSSIYVCSAVFYIIAMSQMFPFALGLSLTRRAVYAATSTMAVGQALVYGTALYLFSLLESATNGWGIDLAFFNIAFMDVDNPLLQILVYAGPFMALSFAGAVIGVIYKRWGTNGVWAVALGGILVGGGLVVLATWQGWWQQIGQWFADQSPAALFVGYCPLVAAILAGVGYLLIRRATP